MGELYTKIVAVTPVVTAGAYSANDAVGGLLTFEDVYGAVSDGDGQRGALLESVVVSDLGKQSIALDLVLFSETFTATADNDAFDVSDTDILNCLGVVHLTDYAAFNDSSLATAKGLGIVIKNTSGDGKLYGQLVTRGTPTYASVSDLTVKIGVVRG